MKKFSKILESLDSEVVSSIKDIFIEFQDKGFTIKIDEMSGYYTINLNCVLKNDWMECVRELVDCDRRLLSIDLEYVDSKYINFGSTNQPSSSCILRYKSKGVIENYDNINSWEEFKSYCENVLGIDGIKDTHFNLHLIHKGSFTTVPSDYEGFIIDYGQSSHADKLDENDELKKEMISHYPGYEEFLNKYLEYGIDWNLIHRQGEWKNRADKTTPVVYPIPFNKEGIEVVKTLMEMIKE